MDADRFKLRTPAPLHLLTKCSSELLLAALATAAEEAFKQQ